ncbi:GGDEF domain-containing protein [Iodobacter fluviatilis]|uniref:diguanylate cyclase n=1 Tax=Iodobacter fluviatilis TaxID=537 RepID=A0A377Q480_9NEIS|nr:GGDEF domain-containing protein [Iodobacter fluviatilis]TCU90600.1 diguanylate cyclase (GGDEF)-like protein [Iodobacter fluviatilis]STQ89627.1 Probable diguanylate cyclase YdaM [Iodobacter fluviatilis]
MPAQKIISQWRILQPIHFVLGLLILLTVSLLLWQHYGMNLFLRFDPGNFNQISASDDRDNEGGKSIGLISINPKYWRLDCQLQKGHRSPYCSIDFDLSKGKQGIDLSKYTDITIRYRYQNPREQVNLVMVNFNPEYSVESDYRSQKFTEVYLPGVMGWSTYTLKWQQFNVASWWIADKKIPPKWTDNEFNNIREIRLATGLYPELSNHQIDLAYIEFRGKWINNNTLQLLLLLLWGGTAAFWLLSELRRSMLALQRSHARQKDLENAQQHLQETNQLLAERSMRDPLTLAFNREGLSILLAKETPDTPGSIIFIDIDHFKKINDHYGHGTGDQVLCLLVQHIQQQIRPSEQLIRLGGEEFVLLCQHSNLAQAERLAEKLRLWLFSQSWPADIPLSCSFGVAERQKGERFEATLHRADLALYRAKAGGRNRVEVAE